jgi:D-alanine-D-alanine ligase
MKKKIRVGVLFGGKSVEHEVSLASAHNVIAALDRDKFDVLLIGIDKKGQWHLLDQQHFLQHADHAKMMPLHGNKEAVALTFKDSGRQLIQLSGKSDLKPLDVIFPVLHGSFGEDGTMQGLLELAGIPYVGSGVLSSAIAMDKDVMKRLFQHAGIPTADFVTLRSHQLKSFPFVKAKEKFGLPLFIKPANTGSSVGVNKVKTEEDYDKALQEAALFDRKIIIETYIPGREIECAVLGNEEPIASIPGEVIPHHDFYSYAAKYLDEKGASLDIPAKLDAAKTKEVQEMAVRAYQVLECEGMARVDFLLRNDGKLFLNEINTIPGFTNISMYPKLWKASGICYEELIEKLIEHAIARHKKKRALKVSYV